MPYRPKSPPHAPTGPNGMIAIVATAVTTEITGAMAIIQGTALAGVKASLESSLSTSAAGCRTPRQPTRLGPMRDWKRPRIFRSASRTIGTICRNTTKIRIDFTIITQIASLGIRRPPLRYAPA